MNSTAYLHFGTGNEPRQTVSVPVRLAPLWWQEKGLQQTASGYGRRLASRYMVKWAGRWMRVYVCQFSNAGTAYIGTASKWLATVQLS